ncbi:hypothetical protein [Streptomyces sp. NPDC006552]|uniref:hypothetical protein n=1 Tax=Streptomyces sp. NPDC006552 TaxID=3157179 RepID=UPI0033A214F5
MRHVRDTRQAERYAVSHTKHSGPYAALRTRGAGAWHRRPAHDESTTQEAATS